MARLTDCNVVCIWGQNCKVLFGDQSLNQILVDDHDEVRLTSFRLFASSLISLDLKQLLDMVRKELWT